MDTSEKPKHLRFTHFTLVTVCIVLLNLHLIEDRESINVAVEQLEQILRAFNIEVVNDSLGEADPIQENPFFSNANLERIQNATVNHWLKPLILEIVEESEIVTGGLPVVFEGNELVNIQELPEQLTVDFNGYRAEEYKEYRVLVRPGIQEYSFVEYRPPNTTLRNQTERLSWPSKHWWIENITNRSIARVSQARAAILSDSIYTIPRSVTEFKEYWQDLEANIHIVAAHSLFSDYFVKTDRLPNANYEKRRWEPVDFSSSQNTDVNASTTLNFVELNDYEARQLRALGLPDEIKYAFVGWGEIDPSRTGNYGVAEIDYRIILPVTIQSLSEIDGRLILGELANPTEGWLDAPFSITFSELDSLTEGFQDLPLVSVLTVLESMRDRSSQSVQLVGIQASASTLLSFGSALIVLIQLYFVLHLVALSANELSISKGFPWIALYDEIPSQLLFLATAFILPPASIFGLSIDTISNLNWNYMEIGVSEMFFIGFSVFLSCWGTKHYLEWPQCQLNPFKNDKF